MQCPPRADEGMDVPGFGSVKSDDSERMTLSTDSAGLQLCFRMSRQMAPLSLCRQQREEAYARRESAQMAIERHFDRGRVANREGGRRTILQW